jgi:hypothetical protein
MKFKYKAIGNEFEKAYNICIKKHPEFNYRKEENFDNQVKYFLTLNYDYFCMFCDDDIWKEEFDASSVKLIIDH